MSNVPPNLKYAKSHEWLHLDGEIGTVGISDHAQHELTDVVFIELPKLGARVKSGEACAVVESVKTASDIYSPVSGEITEINQAAVDNPALANTDPYGAGWFFRIRLSAPEETSALMNAQQYQSHISGT